MLVCGKTVDVGKTLDVTPGVFFGDDVILADLLAKIKADARTNGNEEACSDVQTLGHIIVYQAKQIPHLPIEDVTAIPSAQSLGEFIEKCSTLQSAQEIHDNALAFARLEELLTQLVSAMSTIFVSAMPTTLLASCRLSVLDKRVFGCLVEGERFAFIIGSSLLETFTLLSYATIV